MQYYSHELNIKICRSVYHVESKTREIVDRLERAKKSYVEMLMLFSAIIAFIFSTFSMANKASDFNHAAGIVMFSAASLVLGFGLMSCFLESRLSMSVCVKFFISVLFSIFLGVAGYVVGNGLIK